MASLRPDIVMFHTTHTHLTRAVQCPHAALLHLTGPLPVTPQLLVTVQITCFQPSCPVEMFYLHLTSYFNDKLEDEVY